MKIMRKKELITKKLLTVKQIAPVNTIYNVLITVWRIFPSMLRCKGLNDSLEGLLILCPPFLGQG